MTAGRLEAGTSLTTAINTNDTLIIYISAPTCLTLRVISPSAASTAFKTTYRRERKRYQSDREFGEGNNIYILLPGSIIKIHSL